MGGARKRAALLAVMWSAMLAGLALAQPAGAEQNIFQGYGELIGHVTPAPLIATSLPSSLGPLADVGIISGPEAHGRYSVLYSRLIPQPPKLPRLAADVQVRGLGTRSLAAEARSARHNYREQPTRVRGRPGFLVRARHTATVALLWSEAGRIYELGTSTPHAVSPAQLQATAGELGHLLGELTGSLTTPADEQLAGDALVTEHAVIMRLGWQGACLEHGATFPKTGGEETTVTLALAGQGFTLPPTQVPPQVPAYGEGTWTISAGGSVSPTAGTLTLQGSSVGALLSCNVGPLTTSLHTNPHP